MTYDRLAVLLTKYHTIVDLERQIGCHQTTPLWALNVFQSMVSCSEYKRVFMRFTLARRVFIAILLFDVAFSILTWKADAKDFAVLVFNENAHFQWIWSDNFWSRDSAPPMTVREKQRLYNKEKGWPFYTIKALNSEVCIQIVYTCIHEIWL